MHNENPVRVVTTGHTFRTGDNVSITGVPGGAGLANGASAIHVINNNEFTLDGKNGAAVAAFGTGPIATALRYLGQATITVATLSAPIEIETATPHGCANGNQVRIDGVEGDLTANNTAGRPTWVVTVISPTPAVPQRVGWLVVAGIRRGYRSAAGAGGGMGPSRSCGPRTRTRSW